VEAIRSILPICDEVVVAVGNSDDETLQLIKSIQSSKIKIIETVWDDTLREGGRVLAVETDKAYNAISPDSDWAFYIQGDEVIHEKYLGVVKAAMEKYKDDKAVEGLLFNYVHFYGSYDYVGESYRWYRREIRVVRNSKDIFSYRDAQGFRKKPNEKLRVKHIDASIYHYGYVREPKAMQGKQRSFNKYWHDDQWVEKHVAPAEEFDYSNIDALTTFEGTHPEVMKKRIDAMNWKFQYDISKKKFKLKDRLKRFVEKLTGWRPSEYRNYEIV
jgi:glycosyltransferase involved in cell wall biosynthesis